MRNTDQEGGSGKGTSDANDGAANLEDSEEEGEELLKPVRARKQSLAKLNISGQEKDLLQRLSSVGEGIFT